MNWHNLHPVTKILIATIICLMIGGGAGYIVFTLSEKWDKFKAKQKREAAEPIDCTGINFVYDSSGRAKQLGHELREITRRGKVG